MAEPTPAHYDVRNINILIRFLQGATMPQLEKEFGITRERCKQIVYSELERQNRELFDECKSNGYSGILNMAREKRRYFYPYEYKKRFRGINSVSRTPM